MTIRLPGSSSSIVKIIRDYAHDDQVRKGAEETLFVPGSKSSYHFSCQSGQYGEASVGGRVLAIQPSAASVCGVIRRQAFSMLYLGEPRAATSNSPCFVAAQRCLCQAKRCTASCCPALATNAPFARLSLAFTIPRRAPRLHHSRAGSLGGAETPGAAAEKARNFGAKRISKFLLFLFRVSCFSEPADLSVCCLPAMGVPTFCLPVMGLPTFCLATDAASRADCLSEKCTIM